MSTRHGHRAIEMLMAAVMVAGLTVALISPAGAGPLAEPGAASALLRPPALPSKPQGSAPPLDVRATGRAPDLVTARVEQARAAMLQDIGGQLVISLDPTFGWLRWVARLDGTLTGPSANPPQQIALDFLRTYRGAFGLTHADFATLRFRGDYVDIEGTHHLDWAQRVDGVTYYGLGLKASVAADGSLLELSGPLGTGLSVTGSPHASVTPSEAEILARASVGAGPATPGPTRFSKDTASAVWFPMPDGPSRLAWETVTFVSLGEVDRSVVDAHSGRILWRANMVLHDQAGTGYVWPAWPGTTSLNGGGVQSVTTFPVFNGTALSGNDAHVYVAPTYRVREVPASDPSSRSWYDPAIFDTTRTRQHCSTTYPCTWDVRTHYSWKANMRQSATQLYAFLNAYHDHLLAAPFGFTEAAGNFQLINSTNDGKGGDPVMAVSDVGANGDGHGNPDAYNNAGIYPAPEGQSPFAEFLLFRKDSYYPGFPSVNSADDAMVVYHEYTHGLSNRLVTDPAGEGALNAFESGAMGEAWSDWYALDALETEGYLNDTPAVDLPVGDYVTAGAGIRTQFADCLVTSSAADCPAPTGGTAGAGGYTYGDLTKISQWGPEVHADGEIWLQTLWQLRGAIGAATAESIITRAMELSPPSPSYLDMRDAILMADQTLFGGADVSQIWQVFAQRGMGMFARPSGFIVGRRSYRFVPNHEDFTLPATCPGDPSCASISGRVLDHDHSTPIVGATVRLSGGSAGIPVELAATTDAHGRYRIDDVPGGTYPQLVVSAPGYLTEDLGRTAIHGDRTVSGTLTRNWASPAGGARIIDQTGTTLAGPGQPCTPQKLFDGTPLGWLSKAKGPRSLTLRLPQAVDLTGMSITPGSVCGRSKTAVKAFEVWTRTGAHAPWRLAFRTTAGFPPSRPSSFRPHRAAAGVRFVKIVFRTAAKGGDVIGAGEFQIFGR